MTTMITGGSTNFGKTMEGIAHLACDGSQDTPQLHLVSMENDLLNHVDLAIVMEREGSCSVPNKFIRI